MATEEPTPAGPVNGSQGGLVAANVSGERLDDLQSITDSALSYMSLEEMLSEVLDRIRRALRADTAALLLLDEDRGVLLARAAKGLEEEVRQGVQVPLARGFAGRVAAQVRPLVIRDLSRADVVNPILRQKGIRSMLGVPVHVEGRVIGVLHVGTLRSREFGADDIALLQLAADRIALALDNARLSEQRAVTEVMQRTLLPAALPEVPGLRFSAKYLPAGSGVRIGGDWYDVFALPDGRITFVIGDVVGRGVMAASVMAEVRTALRAYLSEGHELGTVLSLLNELLISMSRRRSATVSILELDIEQGELEVASAGHLPPLLVAPGGEAQFLEPPQGLPLGIRRGATVRSAHYEFPVGSALLLYTDGLIERRGEPLDTALERLAEAARAVSIGGEATFADGVYGAMLEEGPLDDDVALLTIESVGLGARVELTLETDPAVLASLRRTVGRWVSSAGLAPDDVFNVALAVSEAAANAIEHAYGARDGTFEVVCDRSDGHVRVAVSDRGRWRNTKPYGRGRGLSLMSSLVDEVDVHQGEDGTTVTLTKRAEEAPLP